MKKIILNLGCGKTVIKGAVNVDYFQTDYCDRVVNLAKFPWPWEEASVEEIYMLYFLEHFDADEIVKILNECHRILKKDGLLHIQCPHFSSSIALTDLDHKKSFSFSTFNSLEGHNFLFPKPLFKTELAKINVLLTIPSQNKYIDFDLQKTASNYGAHPLLRIILNPFKALAQFFIDLSPLIFERFWCHLVGGADELIYRGRKV